MGEKKDSRVEGKAVISKIEITKSTNMLGELTVKTETKPAAKMREPKSVSLVQYRLNVEKMAKEMVKLGKTLSENLLTVKMALMEAVAEVEREMRENKES